jgi:hypothetical protein
LSCTFKHEARCVTCEEDQPRLITGVYRLPQNVATAAAAFAALMLDEAPDPPAQPVDPAALPSPSMVTLPAPPPMQPAEEFLRDSLMEMLPPTEGWSDAGGLGPLTIIPLPRGQGLAVVMTHTLSVHRQAKKLFDGWQKTPKLPDEIIKLLNLPTPKLPPRRKTPQKPPLAGGFFRVPCREAGNVLPQRGT